MSERVFVHVSAAAANDDDHDDAGGGLMGLVKARSWKSAVMGGTIGGAFFAIAQHLGGSKSALAVHGGAAFTLLLFVYFALKAVRSKRLVPSGAFSIASLYMSSQYVLQLVKMRAA